MAKASGKAASRASPPSTSSGLVAIPDRRNRVHYEVARCIAGRSAEQDADPEIEPVHQHIHEDAEAEDQRAQRNEIERRGHGRGSTTAPAAARAGSERCRPSIGEAASSSPTGPARTMANR